jgi:hypothetical protein
MVVTLTPKTSAAFFTLVMRSESSFMSVALSDFTLVIWTDASVVAGSGSSGSSVTPLAFRIDIFIFHLIALYSNVAPLGRHSFQTVMPKKRYNSGLAAYLQKLSKESAMTTVELEIDRGNDVIRLANLLPIERWALKPPEFTDKTPEEFEEFLDRNFRRTKYGPLRAALDKAAARKVVTPVQLYREIFVISAILHDATNVMDAFAILQDKCPPLRVCWGCGRLFVPSRKDRVWCMTKCGSRVRQEMLRERREYYEENRKLKGVVR